MRPRNICKFTSSSYSQNILISCFVLETDNQVMKTKCNLSKYRMLLVIEGEGNITIDMQTLPLNKGTLLFGFKDEEIFITSNKKCKYMYIDFDGLRAEELLKRFNINKNNRCFFGFDGIIPFWEESLSRALENTIDLAAESVVIYSFSRLIVDTSQHNNVINKILQFTDEQFNNNDLSVSVIADELGYNSKYISHLFKEKMGISYSEYLRCFRVKYATSLFDNGIDSVKNVALLSGFSDPLYFSTVFKKIMGVSPKEYLNKKQNHK